jgi:hypothetical protein
MGVGLMAFRAHSLKLAELKLRRWRCLALSTNNYPMATLNLKRQGNRNCIAATVNKQAKFPYSLGFFQEWAFSFLDLARIFSASAITL